MTFKDEAYWALGKVNQDFLDLEQQDQLLFSWLLTSMFESILTQTVGCRLLLRFGELTQNKEKFDQFNTQLHNTKKAYLSINDYLLKIKTLVHQLRSIGYVLTIKDHIQAIFNGFPFILYFYYLCYFLVWSLYCCRNWVFVNGLRKSNWKAC